MYAFFGGGGCELLKERERLEYANCVECIGQGDNLENIKVCTIHPCIFEVLVTLVPI